MLSFHVQSGQKSKRALCKGSKKHIPLPNFFPIFLKSPNPLVYSDHRVKLKFKKCTDFTFFDNKSKPVLTTESTPDFIIPKGKMLKYISFNS